MGAAADNIWQLGGPARPAVAPYLWWMEQDAPSETGGAMRGNPGKRVPMGAAADVIWQLGGPARPAVAPYLWRLEHDAPSETGGAIGDDGWWGCDILERMIDSPLEPLLRSPMLIDYIDELNRAMAVEVQRRRKFYEEITEERKWEFINGQVIMHSPATNRHNRIVIRLAKLLSTWSEVRVLGSVTVEKTLCQFPRNDYEPDIVFFSQAKASRIQPDTLLHPVPDFVVEVLSESTEQNDRGVKFQDYEAHGVQEYWIIDSEAESVEQYIAEGGRYPKATPQKTGRITSQAVAGFEISVRAIFEDAESLVELRRLLG